MLALKTNVRTGIYLTNGFTTPSPMQPSHTYCSRAQAFRPPFPTKISQTAPHRNKTYNSHQCTSKL